MGRAASTFWIILICAAPRADAGVIHRRGGQPPIQAPIILMDHAGVTVRTPAGETRVIAWDLVRDIVPDVPDHLLGEKLETAEELWRARSRLQRHDPTLAEPLFERLFERYRGQTSESALIVAEGLLRCRLSRGANEAAMMPFLETARLRRADVETDRYDELVPVFDVSWSLCPQLAPVWIDAGALERMQRDLVTYDPQGDEVVAGLAALYRLAARAQSAGAEVLDEDAWPELPRHDGLELLEDLVATASGDEDRRHAVRTRLLNRIPRMPAWAEAWIRYQVGVSLLNEANDDLRRQGMVSLAHLPARFGAMSPYLAGLATARLASALAADGRAEEASVLRAELQRRFPGHPARFLNDDDEQPSDPPKENA